MADPLTAAEIIASLTQVSGALDLAFYNSMNVESRNSVDISEFSTTTVRLSEAIRVLQRVPPAKMESLFSEFTDEFTADLNTFNDKGKSFVERFRAAQILIGYAATVINRSGLRG